MNTYIKKIVPQKIIYFMKLKKYNKNRNKSYKKVEKEIGKKYKKRFHRDLNWNNPKSYTEKINVSKIYGSTELKTNLADKLLVRDWIKGKIGEEYLIKTLGVYNSFDEIDFDSLPNKFVIKCNHDSGSTLVVEDKNNINYKELKNKYDFYLKRNYAYTSYEMSYEDIIPKIIIEENMRKKFK